MLSFNQFVQESQGLTGRVPGEKFVDKDGNELIFQEVLFFDTKDEFEGDLSTVTFVNKPLSNLSALGIVRFKNADGEEVLFGKHLKPGTKAWDNKNPGFFEFRSKATSKEQSGLKPSDFLTKTEDLTPDDILKQVGEAFGEDSPLYLAVEETIESGYPVTPIPIGEMSESGITNYFAEILQPIAVWAGIYTGNAADGVQAIAGTDDLSDFKINFPTGVTQGLYDSYLTSDEKQVNISSKYGSASQSAKASVTNLYKIYKDYKDKTEFEEYETEIEIIRIVAEEHQEKAPVMIAVLLGLLSKKEEKSVYDLKDKPDVKLSDNIIKMRDSIKPGGDGSKSIPFYHVIAGIAKTVSNHINETEDIKFSEFASLLLNGTVIQVYTKTTTKNNTIVFKQFDTKWPDDAVTNVLIESGTRYKTNRVDGKMGYIVKSK